MSEAGFFQQKNRSPAGFLLVVGLHAAAITAVMLAKGTIYILPDRGPIDIYSVPPEQDPDPIPPEPRQDPRPETPTMIDRPDVVVPLPPQPQWPTDTGPSDPQPPVGGQGDSVISRPADPPPPAPVRREAEIDQRFANALQPPYPASEQRAERSGTVRLRVTIGVDGRVKAVERVSATNDAFYAAAERQALRSWRFRPATVDGRPVESTKVMTLHFRIEDV